MAAALWRMGPGVLVCVLEIWLILFFFCIRVFAWSDQRRDANESCCLLKPAAPLRSRVQCVLCGAGFFNCEKCDDWGRATSLLWESPRGDS